MSISPARHADAAPTPLPALDRQVAVARFAAESASVHARSCWAEFVQTLEEGRSCEQARNDLTAAMAEQVYAWAVYHCTRDELQHQRSTP